MKSKKMEEAVPRTEQEVPKGLKAITAVVEKEVGQVGQIAGGIYGGLQPSS